MARRNGIPTAACHTMHRFPSRSVIFRFRFGAALFVLRSILLAVGVPMLLVSMLYNIREPFVISATMLAAFPVVVLLQWLVAAKARCPLCFGQPLMQRGCVKSRKARRFLFSYRLQVALQSLFAGHFRCPYCGEPSQMKARERVVMED